MRRTHVETRCEIENRGSESFPFGYIYFEDDTRLGFTFEGEHIRVWTANWGPVTSFNIQAAKTALTDTFSLPVTTKR